ncbi:MAG: protein kinase [Rubripirellula sp.]
MADTETKFEWAAQIAVIRKRFEAAIRAGDTIDGLDQWVSKVPEQHQAELRQELEQCSLHVGQEMIETRVLTSDASLGCSSIHEALSFDDLTGETAVKDCRTFQGMSNEAKNALQENLRAQSFASGTRLLEQGEKARGLHLILKGSVDIIDTEAGERIDCDGAGSVLGEMSLLTGQPCSAEVVATSDVQALVLSNESYAKLKTEHPELEIALSQLVSDRLGGRRHDALCGKTIGDYQLTRCINRGGMGVVYEAIKVAGEDQGVRVALKMLRHRFIYDDQMQIRFDQEAKLLEELAHPNVVSFRDHFLAFRTRFLVLDLCDGADLYQLLRVHGALGEDRVRAVLGQIAQGLMYAQEAGVIHRDLKPGNVLVDRSGLVKLTDFGLSKLLESEVPEGKAVGTPSYMPPEQFRSENIGPEADWYALGCLACEMLTGQILFQGENWMDLFRKKGDCFPSASWPNIKMSPELRKVIHGSLQPRPKARTLDLEAVSDWAQCIDDLF